MLQQCSLVKPPGHGPRAMAGSFWEALHKSSLRLPAGEAPSPRCNSPNSKVRRWFRWFRETAEATGLFDGLFDWIYTWVIHGLYMGYTGLYINWYTCNRIINISTHTWSSWKQLVEILFVVALFECQLVQFIVSWMHHSWFFQCLCHNGDWSIFAPYVHVVEGLRHAAERWVPSLIFGDGPRICW